jgi:hypothetical protein
LAVFFLKLLNQEAKPLYNIADAFLLAAEILTTGSTGTSWLDVKTVKTKSARITDIGRITIQFDVTTRTSSVSV